MNQYQSITDLIAIALEYGGSGSPVVNASGKGFSAKTILEIARQKGIPIECNPELASMLGLLEVGDVIPVEAFIVVAEILAFIYSINKKS